MTSSQEQIQTAQTKTPAMRNRKGHRRTGIFLPGGAVNHLPKKCLQVAQILRNSRKETGVLRCTNNGLHMKWNFFHIWIYIWVKNTFNLKEIAVSSISTAGDINDAVHVMADNRVGICPFNVNKSNVADTLLPHGAAEVSFQSARMNTM